MTRRPAVLLLVLVLVAPVAARAGEFDAVVKGIEKYYGIKRMHPRLIGFAMFLAKPATWGSGVGGLKVAVFENEDGNFDPSVADLESIMAKSVGAKWRPFVRVRSRKDGEATVIYTRFSGKHMQMLIATVETEEIAVIQMKISKGGIQKWIHDPESEARGSSHRHRD